MKLNFYTSHLTVTSNDESKEGKNSKNNMINVEKYIKRMILISMRKKKYFEKHDYFYEEEKRRKFDLKNLKIRPTPFQIYQKLKIKNCLTAEKLINNNKKILTFNPINNNEILLKNKQNPIIINNLNLKNKNKTKSAKSNNQFFRTQLNFFRPQKSVLFHPNENTDLDDNNTMTSPKNNTKFTKYRAKSHYHTININKTNKIIQTTDQKNISRKKINYKLDKFPVLDIFNYKTNLKMKNPELKSRNNFKERKKSLPFFNNDERKITCL